MPVDRSRQWPPSTAVPRCCGNLLLVLQLSALLTGCRLHTRIPDDLVDLYPIAERLSDRSVTGSLLGRTVTVHYPGTQLDEETALRFLHELEAFQREREEDYAALRAGIQAHLGDALYVRIQDSPELRTRDLESTWFLFAGEYSKPLYWRGPGASYYLLEPHDPPYTTEELKLRSKLRYEVHTKTHFLLRELESSRRGYWGRWLEEGICDYVAMQFERWKLKRYDTGRDLLARLTWQRPSLQRKLLTWSRHDPMDPPTGWDNDLLYKGSLGLVLSLEHDLGNRELLDLLKDLIERSPEKDQQLRAIIETHAGRPLEQVGRLSQDARLSLQATLLARASTACREGSPASEGLPLGALGHFPEAAQEVVPVLLALAGCPDVEVALEGLTGLRYLGDRRLLQQALERFEEGRDAAALASARKDGRWRMSREFAESPNWYEIKISALS